MGRPISQWDKPYIEGLRRKHLQPQQMIPVILMPQEGQLALQKLLTLYAPPVQQAFADRMLMLSKLPE